MRIIGAHSILYSRNAEADRAFLRDVLGLPGVDVGGGWLIFGLPPAEVAVHPSEKNDVHEFYLMCDDVAAFVARMEARGVRCDSVQNMGWGILTQVSLPGGGKVGVYQPRHARPKPMRAAAGKIRKGAAAPRRGRTRTRGQP
jgi:catechol 2,3-dioxygenase-like lactoylglutathione lyase family enzyme